ncbi:hypothetical protein Ccrd_000872, partial [Cynara cardunculus var. scolymus]
LESEKPIGCYSASVQVAAAVYDRQQVADHAQNLATKIRNNLTNSMKSLGVDILTGFGIVVGPQKVKYGKVGGSETLITTKDIIIGTGSVPFVPKGVEVDVPEWIVIVGSGYIGLKFSDVYTTLGSDFCRSIRSVDAWFDPENGELAQRVLVNPRKIDYPTDGKPVAIELIDAKTKELKDTLECLHDFALMELNCTFVQNVYEVVHSRKGSMLNALAMVAIFSCELYCFVDPYEAYLLSCYLFLLAYSIWGAVGGNSSLMSHGNFHLYNRGSLKICVESMDCMSLSNIIVNYPHMVMMGTGLAFGFLVIVVLPGSRTLSWFSSQDPSPGLFLPVFVST